MIFQDAENFLNICNRTQHGYITDWYFGSEKVAEGYFGSPIHVVTVCIVPGDNYAFDNESADQLRYCGELTTKERKVTTSDLKEIHERVFVKTKYHGQCLRITLVRDKPVPNSILGDELTQAELIIEAGTRVTIGLSGVKVESI